LQITLPIAMCAQEGSPHRPAPEINVAMSRLRSVPLPTRHRQVQLAAVQHVVIPARA